jgi:hypothetical protein
MACYRDRLSPFIFYSKQNLLCVFACFVFSARLYAEEFQHFLLPFSKLQPSIFAPGRARRKKTRVRKGRGSKEENDK